MRSIDVSHRAYVRSMIREMRRALAENPDAPMVTTGPLDPVILEEVLEAACRASPRIRKHDKFFQGEG